MICPECSSLKMTLFDVTEHKKEGNRKIIVAEYREYECLDCGYEMRIFKDEE